MKIKTKGEFFQALKASKLLSPEERVETRDAARGVSDPEAVARMLVDSGKLTRWQAGQLMSGRTKLYLGRYKLLKICGRGGMGVVFKAEQPGVGRTVAIKVLHRSMLAKPRAVARFQREMQLAAALNHPNIVVAFDADKIKDNYFLVMEYVSGKSLKYYSQKHGRLPIAWSIECVRQAALGMMHIHEVGLVHRDIKPSNIIVVNDSFSKSPRVKILDVGLSRFASENETQNVELTNDGQILGTMDYMAPEQVQDARTADIRADIYGLGATLFQLLTGSPPLVGKTLMQTYLARMGQEVPSVSGIRAGVPPALDAIVKRMLHRDPEQRYQKPSDVVEALDVLLSGVSLRNPDDEVSREHSARSVRIESSVDFDTTHSSASIEYQGDSDSSCLGFLDQVSLDQSLDESDETHETAPRGHLEKFRAGTRSHSLMGSIRRWIDGWLESRARKRAEREAAEIERHERDVREARERLRKARTTSPQRNGSANSSPSVHSK